MDKETASAVVEVLVDKKRQLRTMETAAAEISKLTGLTPDIAKAMMKGFTYLNVTDIRGYEKTPPHLIAEREARLGRKKK